MEPTGWRKGLRHAVRMGTRAAIGAGVGATLAVNTGNNMGFGALTGALLEGGHYAVNNAKDIVGSNKPDDNPNLGRQFRTRK